VHKTTNVIAKLPKSQQPKAKRALQEIWMAETNAADELAWRSKANRWAIEGQF
jgi:transposase-like protein